MANATTVILMVKGLDATPSGRFVAIRSVAVQQCPHPRTAPVSPVSRYSNDSQQRSGRSLHVTIYVR